MRYKDYVVYYFNDEGQKAFIVNGKRNDLDIIIRDYSERDKKADEDIFNAYENSVRPFVEEMGCKPITEYDPVSRSILCILPKGDSCKELKEVDELKEIYFNDDPGRIFVWHAYRFKNYYQYATKYCDVENGAAIYIPDSLKNNSLLAELRNHFLGNLFK